MEVRAIDAVPDKLIHGKYNTILSDFLASVVKFAEVILDDGVTARQVYNSIRSTIKNHHYPITPVVRMKRLFLIKGVD